MLLDETVFDQISHFHPVLEYKVDGGGCNPEPDRRLEDGRTEMFVSNITVWIRIKHKFNDLTIHCAALVCCCWLLGLLNKFWGIKFNFIISDISAINKV